jgi:hypothetical protein
MKTKKTQLINITKVLFACFFVVSQTLLLPNMALAQFISGDRVTNNSNSNSGLPGLPGIDTLNTNTITNANLTNTPGGSPGVNSTSNNPGTPSNGNSGAYNPLNIDYSNTFNANTGWDSNANGVPDSIELSETTQQRTNSSGSNNTNTSGTPGLGYNSLYPAGVPGNFDVESFGVDFVSCIGGLMAVELSKVPLQYLDRLGDYLSRATIAVTRGLSVHTFGLAGVAGEGAVLGVQDEKAEDSIEKSGVRFGDIPAIPPLDGVAFCLKNVFIARMTAAITDWIDEGANEAAAYVQDFEDLLNDVATISYVQTIGDLNLCVNIRGTVNASVLVNWLSRRRADPNIGQCTLILDREYELIIRGEAWSYERFHQLVSDPRNNALAGTLLLTSRANAKSDLLEKKYTTELGWSEGFWNWVNPNTGVIQSPGQMITNKLFEKLTLQEDSVALSNDYNQIMLMISNQLIKKVINDNL